MKMKTVSILILMFLSAAAQAQISVPAGVENNEMATVQVLTSKDSKGNDKFTTKLLADEITVQFHNGEEAYKTVRDVEYQIKAKGDKISKKRKILQTKAENIIPKKQAEPVFPDMTGELLSSVFRSKTVKKEKEQKMFPFAVVKNSDGTTCIQIDKLAYAKSAGTEAHVKGSGADLQYEVMTEELRYNSQDEMLYLDSLNEIISTVSLISKEKSGKTNKVEIREVIKIKSQTKQ